jgi:choline dehydrogenase-like flavoprotein
MIRDAADVAGGFTAETEICVVGSGAGGGTAAFVLAGAGREVLLLEEGPHVPRERMTQREEQMYPLLYRDGGNQLTDDGGVSVLQGRVVGGSTVVNMADVVGVPDGVLAHWQQRYGVDRYSLEQVRQSEQVCREVIGAQAIARSQLNRNNERLLLGAERLGLPGGVMEHNRTGCLGSGYCLVGCAYDAKRSVAVTFLARALATGKLTVQAEAKVERFETDGRRVTAVTGHLQDPHDARLLAPFRVQAERFVLAAGAIHSPLLLMASGLGGPAVGQHLSLQPQAPVAARFPDQIVMWRGIPQAAYVDLETVDAARGLGGFRLEAVSGTPGMSAVSMALPASELHAFMADLPRAAANLCLVPDEPVGSVSADRRGRPAIRYPLSAACEARLREAIGTAARCWLAAGADAVILPFPEAPLVRSERDLRVLDSLRVRAASTPLLSAHPQGTCRMGRDPASSVVGLDLKVHGMDNLWVMDASVFPTTSSSHTQLPVMTFAHLGVSELL